MKLKITFKMGILIALVILSIFSLFLDTYGLTFLQDGVIISSIESTSQLYNDGLRQDMHITKINNIEIKNLQDYQEAIKPFYELEQNQTIRTEIIVRQLKESIIGLYGNEFINDLRINEIPSSKLKTGLDLRGGARAFIEIKGEYTENDVNDVISVLEERLNAYGLTDLRLYKIQTSGQEILIGVEIAGSTPEQLESLIGEQGFFEAKVANQTVFIGGDQDITHVARTGEQAIVYNCRDSQDASYCDFQFQITLSTKAADKFAEITKDLPTIENCNPVNQGCYLTEEIIFYLDGINTSSLKIAGSLKGRAETTISITGSESGQTQQDAAEKTRFEMKRLQTILITGSLPQELEIVKIDRISPNLSENFTKQILRAGLFAIIAITLFTFIRYRKIKMSLALVTVSLSELLMILGIAALINWNLDLPSIAGIIAAIGTGIDSQIIIMDESRNKEESLKEQIKKALFIISTAFATTLVALLPLTGALGFLGIGAASAGLLKGFAITTLIGITIGVLISRPAFADIVKQLEE